MADRFSATLVGTEQLERDLRRLNPETNRRITEPALVESMLLTLRIAAQEKIKRGGQSVRGKQDKALPGKLTSRTGTLSRSLGFGLSGSLDTSGLSRGVIEGGTNLVYGAVHEFGKNPRPFLKPALEDASAQFDDIFRKHWKKAGGL